MLLEVSQTLLHNPSDEDNVKMEALEWLSKKWFEAGLRNFDFINSQLNNFEIYLVAFRVLGITFGAFKSGGLHQRLTYQLGIWESSRRFA
jgi:hypothetical protein